MGRCLTTRFLEFRSAVKVEHLLATNTGTCWWCQQLPATTGEHKFKRTDLTRMMSDDLVYWRDHQGNLRPIRGKSGAKRDRYGVVKFEKSLCTLQQRKIAAVRLCI